MVSAVPFLESSKRIDPTGLTLVMAGEFGDGHMRELYITTRASLDDPFDPPTRITAVSSDDGRVLISMPHPERVFRTAQMSWHPADWGHYSPWMRMFDNARGWVDARRR